MTEQRNLDTEVWTVLEALVDAGNVAYGFMLGSSRAPGLLFELNEVLTRAQQLILAHDLELLSENERRSGQDD